MGNRLKKAFNLVASGAACLTGGVICFAAVRALKRLAATLTDERRANAAIVSYPTMFGTARIYTICQDEQTGASDEHETRTGGVSEPAWIRVLEIDGAYQAATYIDDERVYDLVFDYYKMYDHLFEALGANSGQPEQTARSAPRDHIAPHGQTSLPLSADQPEQTARRRQINLLMMGGGGYAYPKHVIAHHPEARIDVVEIDPDITLLAERYFFLDRLIEEFETERTGRLGLVCDDALSYLESCNVVYDAILNDTFAGKHPVESLLTSEALHLAKSRLAPEGLYLANVISALEGPAAVPLEHLVDTLFGVFRHVYVVPCGKYPVTETDNHMVIATDGDYTFADAIPQLRPVRV